MSLHLLFRIWTGKYTQMLPHRTAVEDVVLECPLICCKGTLVSEKELCLQVT